MNNAHSKHQQRLDSAIKQYLLHSKKNYAQHKPNQTSIQVQSRNHPNLSQVENKQIFSTLQTNGNVPTQEVPIAESLNYTSERGVTVSSTQSSPTYKRTEINKKIEISNQFLNSDPLNVSFSKKQSPRFTIVQRLYIHNIAEFHQIRETVKC